jgi:hypothetical protein
MAVQVDSFHFLEGWIDVRDLDEVLEHEERSAPSGIRSSAIASQDHQRSVVRRRRDERRAFRMRSSRATEGRARRAIVETCRKEAATSLAGSRFQMFAMTVSFALQNAQ